MESSRGITDVGLEKATMPQKGRQDFGAKVR